MKRMTDEEFYKAKAEAEKKGERWKVFIDKDYGSDFHALPLDESKLTEADRKRLANNRRLLDQLIKEFSKDEE